MKWEVKKMDEEKWGVFLMEEFCKTDDEVCYGVATSEAVAERVVNRLNDPEYWMEDVDRQE